MPLAPPPGLWLHDATRPGKKVPPDLFLQPAVLTVFKTSDIRHKWHTCIEEFQHRPQVSCYHYPYSLTRFVYISSSYIVLVNPNRNHVELPKRLP